MSEKSDPEKIQKEIMEAMKRMMPQGAPAKNPESQKVEEEKEDKQKKKREHILAFDRKPKDVKRHLDRYVIKQEEAKRVLATAVCDHYNYVRDSERGNKLQNYTKQNILMLGPTGVGKTYLVKSLAELIGVPFVKADATKFSETGYVGGDVEDLIRDLVHQAEGDVELAKYGMVYIDEIDKISTPSQSMGRDVSGTGVQRGLLKIMEDTDVPLRAQNDIQSQIQAMFEYQQKGKLTKPTLNTRHVLFIVSGAFGGLESIVARRLKSQAAGFNVDTRRVVEASASWRLASTADFIQYGFEPEFVGRLPVRVVCDHLMEEDLYRVLTSSEGSILRQYEASFRAYGINMSFDDMALWEIAKQAGREETGARGLLTVCERTFRDLKFEFPSSHVKDFTLTPEMVVSPKEGLRALLREERTKRETEIQAAIDEFERTFLAKSGLAIEFDQSAREAVVLKIIEEGQESVAFLEQLLSNYAYGLGLIQKKKPRDKFVLDAQVIHHPNSVLDAWVKDSYET
ncbi:MAG: AAA family ATPase [Candidatus Omnitrophota bacterium]|nr:AAA family ATPase [Candidatus Omnitrophota bacterium]